MAEREEQISREIKVEFCNRVIPSVIMRYLNCLTKQDIVSIYLILYIYFPWIRKILYIFYFPCIREIWRFFHPRKVIFPEGNAPEKYDYFKGEQIFISPLCKGNKCFIPPGQRFGEFCQMKSFDHLCLQNYYFGTSLELIALFDQSV